MLSLYKLYHTFSPCTYLFPCFLSPIMGKPIPLSQVGGRPQVAPVTVPPVTIGASGPVANFFDRTGRFRSRTSSYKRPRTDDDPDNFFNLSLNYPPLTLPPPPSIDLDNVKSLLIDNSKMAAQIAAMAASDDCDPNVKVLADAWTGLFKLIEATLEKAVLPMGDPSFLAATGRNPRPPPPTPLPKPVDTGRALRAALECADKQSVLFDADLGPNQIANKNAMSVAFSTTVKALTVANAEKAAADADESMRVVEDALSCVDNMEFLGQRTKKFINNRDSSDARNNTFCTLPIKLDFPDRGSRMHFERTFREKCGLRATMSLPTPIRKELSAFNKAVRSAYPDKIVMTRPDIATLSFVAFIKEDGAGSWTKCPATHPIPHNIIDDNYNTPSDIHVSRGDVVDHSS